MATKPTRTSKTPTRKAPKYTSQPQFLHRLTKNQLIASIVITGVALIGVLSALFSSAATPVGVNFVLVCPPSGYTCTGSTSTIASQASSVRSWYAAKLGNNRTFSMGSVTMRRVLHAPSYYNDTSSDPSNTAAHYAPISKIASDFGLSDSSANATKTVLVMGFQVEHLYCGYSAVPGSLPLVDPVACPNSTLEPALMAHELGHSFGMAADGVSGGAIHRTDGTLMNSYTSTSAAGTVCGGQSLGNCNLNSTDRNYLLTAQSAWFPAPSAPTGTLSCAHNSTAITLVVNYSNTTSGVYIYKNSALLTGLTATSAVNTPVATGTVTPHVYYTFVMTTRSSSPVELARISCSTL